MYRILPFLIAVLLSTQLNAQSLEDWQSEFPKADFSQTSIDFGEVSFDGARRDSIPPIHDPIYVNANKAEHVSDLEPVISMRIGGQARAYPLSIMLWHEIVNDVVGGVPILVSYCPLCNSGVVYDRRVKGRTLSFGNTGRIRFFDMVMYDHQSESWWQQFSGSAIIGTRLGQRMKLLPSRIESVAAFRARAPNGLILVPNNPNARPYGSTPYVNMDKPSILPRFSKAFPVPKGIDPMAYFVVIKGKAWPLERLRKAGTLIEDGLVFNWTAGRNSLHDTRDIAKGRDLGNVTVARTNRPGVDVAYDLVFAFAFSAFLPNGIWMLNADN